MPDPADSHQKLWGHHYERFGRREMRAHRLLALDGGGIRGALTLEILAEIESQLAALTGRGKAFRLCDYFDYIGGTSTGAIIATGLSIGMSVEELTDFYVSIGPDMFQKARLLSRLKHFYTADPLVDQLRKTFGKDTTLGSDKLRCLLLAVTRNVSTDSAWPVSSAPPAKYNERGRKNCNLKMPLWRLVRASTAAPVFFPPEILQWDENDPESAAVFVDGGITPYNNPAFLLFRMATAPAFRLGWPTGEDKLMIMSVGTGGAANLGPQADAPESLLPMTILGLPPALMDGASVDQDTNCRVIGRCVFGAVLDRELHDLIPRGADGRSVDPDAPVTPLSVPLERQFLYARYNADLSERGLAELGIPNVDSKAIQRLDAVELIDDLRRIGKTVAKRDVRIAQQFGALASLRT